MCLGQEQNANFQYTFWFLDHVQRNVQQANFREEWLFLTEKPRRSQHLASRP